MKRRKGRKSESGSTKGANRVTGSMGVVDHDDMEEGDERSKMKTKDAKEEEEAEEEEEEEEKDFLLPLSRRSRKSV